ncbi:MAG: restriction endonuclease [Cyanobacteriota bacterium]|nr:restriction endonuclease [Cyanobacteriota bacterium]
MNYDNLDRSLEEIVDRYRLSFANKVFLEESSEEDDLMKLFGLTQATKAQNKQYWGRELGACWERLVKEICQQTCDNYCEPQNSTYDLLVGRDAIDTKYRIGSGDAKTLRGWRQNGQDLLSRKLRPILLIIRNDSLQQAIATCRAGGWVVKSGNDAYDYLYELTQFDLQTWLRNKG